MYSAIFFSDINLLNDSRKSNYGIKKLLSFDIF